MLTAQTVPLVAFLLVGGVRRQARAPASDARCGRAAGVAEARSVPGYSSGNPPLWGFLLCPALVGTGIAFFMPSLTGLIPQIVPGIG